MHLGFLIFAACHGRGPWLEARLYAITFCTLSREMTTTVIPKGRLLLCTRTAAAVSEHAVVGCCPHPCGKQSSGGGVAADRPFLYAVDNVYYRYYYYYT